MTSISLRGLVCMLVLLVAGPGFALGSATAAGAATCTTSGGVSVVVDYRELGGSTITACAADGADKSAAAIFAEVGVQLSYATRQPGFVCRVNGAPTSDPCVNASPSNAYWGLWWADGSRASWTYSSSGVGSLTVPAGGSVGWSWQQDRVSGSSVPPSVAPPVAQSSTPTPTSSPTPTQTPSPTSSATPTASPSANAGGGGGGGGSSQPSPTASATASPTRGGNSGGSGSTPSAGSDSPSAPESAGTPTTDDSTLAPESPSDSRTSGKDGAEPLASESPSDSSASVEPSTTAGQAAASEPSRLPAGVTWAVLGLLAVAIAASAFIARRRRVSDAS